MSNRVPKAVSDSGSHLHNGVVGPPIGAWWEELTEPVEKETGVCLFVSTATKRLTFRVQTNKQTNKRPVFITFKWF